MLELTMDSQNEDDTSGTFMVDTLHRGPLQEVL